VLLNYHFCSDLCRNCFAEDGRLIRLKTIGGKIRRIGGPKTGDKNEGLLYKMPRNSIFPVRRKMELIEKNFPFAENLAIYSRIL
jgi:hypothetical protein